MKYFVTHVIAEGINPDFFGGELNPIPDVVYTTEDADLNTIFVSVKIVARADSGDPIYKIFSNYGLFVCFIIF